MSTCTNCVYFNACGDERRTAPCTGFQSKEERKARMKAKELEQMNDPHLFDMIRDLAGCNMKERYDDIVKKGIKENDPSRRMAAY